MVKFLRNIFPRFYITIKQSVIVTQSIIATLIMYCADEILKESEKLEEISEILTTALGFRLGFRALISQCSTVLIFDVYGDVSTDQFLFNLLHLPCTLLAVAVDNGDRDPSLVDNLMQVIILPTWSCIVDDVKPPSELFISDLKIVLILKALLVTHLLEKESLAKIILVMKVTFAGDIALLSKIHNYKY